ncbi:MAG: hypothetical protein WA453_00990 [Methyloceanibacter sp.]
MKRKAQKASDLVRPGFVMREGLRQALAHEAELNQQTLSREINVRLERSLQADAMKTIVDVASDLTKLLARARKQLAA